MITKIWITKWQHYRIISEKEFKKNYKVGHFESSFVKYVLQLAAEGWAEGF